jgi:antitoxin component YwqK of YwqJK toxin-antitoxin module
MKNFLVFIMFTLFSVCGFSNDNVLKVSHWENGQVKEIVEKDNGRVFRLNAYYVNGDKRETGFFVLKDNKLVKTGKWVSYTEKGEKSTIAFFDNKGNKTGVWHFWDKDGHLVLEITYEKNKVLSSYFWTPDKGLIVKK